MSTIWTPSGEYVPKPEREPEPDKPPEAAAGRPGPGPGREPTTEEREAALAEARAVLAQPVLEHVAAHVMGLFELAALHLEREAATGGKERPDLAETSLAIDAMAALVEGLGDRLGKYQGGMSTAVAQLRLAFVEARNRAE